MKALPFPRDVLFFAIPSAVMALAIYVSVPRLDHAGAPLAVNVLAHFVLLLGGLGLLGVVLAFREAPGAIAVRMGFSPLRITDLLIGLLIGGCGLWLYDALQGISSAAVSGLHLDAPDWLTRFHTDTAFLDIRMAGRWWLLDVFALFYIANVVGEELWWRGYILPRQIAAGARTAWLRNGLLWCGFHVFFAWDVLALVPIAIMIAAAVQWRRSVWIGIVAHATLNSVTWPILWHGIIGPS
ncbi:MAG TPA: CPBP family intramembrane glutamic endopeptidase [Steroidobacteraceae bacterium]|nr:CPBP family intramembrane glutamic endopeptidase [Steroidobacteraceae bacterium]